VFSCLLGKTPRLPIVADAADVQVWSINQNHFFFCANLHTELLLGFRGEHHLLTLCFLGG
jgi:hypothetical protein